MSPPDAPLLAFLRAIPKAELHCHLLGTVRRATFTELAHRERAPLSDAEIEAFYTRGEKPVGVLRVLRALDAWLLKRPDDLHRITYEYLQDAALIMPDLSRSSAGPITIGAIRSCGSRASPIGKPGSTFRRSCATCGSSRD